MAIGSISPRIGAGAAPAGTEGSAQLENLKKQKKVYEKKLKALRSGQGDPAQIEALEKKIKELEQKIEKAEQKIQKAEQAEKAGRKEDEERPESPESAMPQERRFDRYEKGMEELEDENPGLYHPQQDGGI